MNVYDFNVLPCLVDGRSDWANGSQDGKPTKGIIYIYFHYFVHQVILYTFYFFFHQQLEELQTNFNARVQECSDLSDKLDYTQVNQTNLTCISVEPYIII